MVHDYIRTQLYSVCNWLIYMYMNWLMNSLLPFRWKMKLNNKLCISNIHTSITMLINAMLLLVSSPNRFDYNFNFFYYSPLQQSDVLIVLIQCLTSNVWLQMVLLIKKRTLMLFCSSIQTCDFWCLSAQYKRFGIFISFSSILLFGVFISFSSILTCCLFIYFSSI